MHQAAENGNIECLKVLMEHGANVNTIDGWGYTPLDVAKYRNRKKTYSILISYGAQCRECCFKKFGIQC